MYEEVRVMKNKVREGIAWAIAVVVTAVILTVAMGALFYAINYLLAYALGVPMLGYMQLCALGLVCVIVKCVFEYL